MEWNGRKDGMCFWWKEFVCEEGEVLRRASFFLEQEQE